MSRMPRHPALLLCVALSPFAAFAVSAQARMPPDPAPIAGSSSGHLLEFEVATIKPIDPHATGGGEGADVSPGGTVKLNALTLKAMIEVAFNVSYWQIQGGEPWMEKSTYDVVGKPPESVRQTMPDTRHTWFTIADPRLREMLQSLLIQRFQLKVHRSMEPGKVYFLERTDKPLALHSTHPESPSSSPVSHSGSIGWAGQWAMFDATMPQLANFTSSFMLHRPVIDHTGLTGGFDYRAALDAPNASIADQNASFMQMLKDAGLKLKEQQGETEILTIDRAEPPSAN